MNCLLFVPHQIFCILHFCHFFTNNFVGALFEAMYRNYAVARPRTLISEVRDIPGIIKLKTRKI